MAIDYQGHSFSAGIESQLPPDVVQALSQKGKIDPSALPQLPSSLSNAPSVGGGGTIPHNAEETLPGLNISKKQKKKQNVSAAQTTPASLIEQQYRHRYSSDLSKGLQQFGYDIFYAASPKASSLAVPDKNYILGTGDSLLIRVWGTTVDTAYPVVVDREGIINVPKLGPIPVAGVTYGDVESVVRKEAEKYIQGINISITLNKLRSLEVYVVGEVPHPGLHILPAFSTIFDGLLYAGGVKKTGTLRKINLYRNDKKIRNFDLYDLLLRGNRKSDVSLQNKDVIFVGDIGKTAAVAGAVNTPAIFEIQTEKNIQQLLTLAGGILPQAFGERIYLRRFVQNREFMVQDIDTVKKQKGWTKISITDGDLVELKFMESNQPWIVRLKGNVWKPDIFSFKEGLKLSEILTSPDLLMPNTLLDFALIFRYNRDSTRTTPLRFPLARVFDGSYDAPLQPFDQIKILARSDIGITEHIQVNGAVWKKGTFTYQPGLRLTDALALAGGLKFGAGTDRIELARQNIHNNQVETRYQPLNLTTDKDFLLQPYDSILVPMMKDATRIKTITISGEVKFPGTYTIRKNEKVSDLIHRTGGFTEDAYFYGARYTSAHARKIQQESIDKMIEQLQLGYLQNASEATQTATSVDEAQTAKVANQAMQSLFGRLRAVQAEGRVGIKLTDLNTFRDSTHDFTLQNGDTLVIPPKPMFVSVVGSVYSPGSFLFEAGTDLDYYLQKSGGPHKTADRKHIYLLKANGEIISMAQEGGFFSSFGKTRLMPGDTIVVPENLDRAPYLRRIKDISDIVFKIATTAGVALAI